MRRLCVGSQEDLARILKIIIKIYLEFLAEVFISQTILLKTLKKLEENITRPVVKMTNEDTT